MSNDFNVLEVNDSMEEDAEGRVNDIENHLYAYSSKKKGLNQNKMDH